MIIFYILTTLSLDNVWTLLGENCCWSLLGLKGLNKNFKPRAFQGLQRTHFPFFKDSIFAKKRLEFMSFLVLPQHEEFYPEGLSLFAPFRLQFSLN